jgi:hypothetical protein
MKSNLRNNLRNATAYSLGIMKIISLAPEVL